MNSFLENVALFIAMGTIAAWVLTFFLEGKLPLIVGFGVMAVLLAFARHSSPILFVYAIFSPIGILLPALCLGWVASRLGFPSQPFSMLELLTGLCLLVVFYLSVAGVIQTDIYNYGYSAWGAAGLTFGVALYGFATGRVSAVTLAILAQLLWMSGWAGENIFDIFGHALLIFVILAELGFRALESPGLSLPDRGDGSAAD